MTMSRGQTRLVLFGGRRAWEGVSGAGEEQARLGLLCSLPEAGLEASGAVELEELIMDCPSSTEK